MTKAIPESITAADAKVTYMTVCRKVHFKHTHELKTLVIYLKGSRKVGEGRNLHSI